MNSWALLFLSWVVASAATAGSLFFSEVMKYPPCSLCWYQRICMYPLVLIFLAGLVPFERKVFRFSFPLVVIGWLIGIYHNLLYFGVIPETASPCSQGVSCASRFMRILGFIDIPQMSLAAFSVILLLLILFKRKSV